MAQILTCIRPTSPILVDALTPVFGVPKGTTGRAGKTIKAIVIHCLGVEAEAYKTLMCSGTTSRTHKKHASMHYVVGNGGNVFRGVEDDNIAWAFQSYPGNFPTATPATAYPGLPAAAGEPGVPADFYTLNIGIASESPRTGQPCSECTHSKLGLDKTGYAKLVHLVAWLADVYAIPVDDQNILFEDSILSLLEGEEECLCKANACLVCDVADYCETCGNPADPAHISGQLAYVYGETTGGCKAKMTLADFKALLATLP
jgi:hypothetical protein